MISNKVVGFALFGLLVVVADSFIANQKNNPCQELIKSESLFNFDSFKQHSMSFSPRQIQPSVLPAKIQTNKKTTQILEQCLAPEHNSVSWLDWVFSNDASGSFHYLDLLELFTPSYESGSSDRTRPGT